MVPALTLRPLRAADRAEYLRVVALSDALHRPWTPLRPPGDTWESLFARQLRVHRSRRAWKGVAVLPDGRIGGFFNLNELARGAFQNAYAGWSVNAEVAGQGVGTEGVRLLLERAFAPPPDGLGLHRVQANILPRNARSVRVAEKNGMRREGLALRYVQIAGVWEDHLLYARVCDEGPVRPWR